MMSDDDSHTGLSSNRQRVPFPAVIGITIAVTLALVFAGTKVWTAMEDRGLLLPSLQSTPPVPQTPLALFVQPRGFKSVSGNVVFVTKDIYGGDLSHGAILKGKIRNVSKQPIKDVVVLWMMYGTDQSPFETYIGQYRPSVFTTQIEYLDSKAEADFNVTLDFDRFASSGFAERIRDAIIDGRHEAGLYVRPQTPSKAK
jgi:hypothetical protein